MATVSVQEILDKSQDLPELLDDNSTTPILPHPIKIIYKLIGLTLSLSKYQEYLQQQKNHHMKSPTPYGGHNIQEKTKKYQN